MHGEGTWIKKDGEKYRGTFKEGRKHGKATEIHKDGKRIDCHYEDGVLHGDFVEYDKNGNITRKGKYDKGILVN
jgi:antitoxin component YwqK of YwqJK toxin-antitoxin module